jgi:hypothetical protein
MDISSLNTRQASEEGRDMVIIGPDGQATDATLKLVGQDSREYSRVLFELRRKSADIEFSVEKFEAETIALVEACTIGWSGLTDGGKDLKFSKDAIRKLYESAPYIVIQAYGFIRDRSNFLASA